MSAARRRGVGVGDRILAEGVPNVVVSVSGARVRLADDEGRVQTVTAADLADGTRFGIPSPVSPRGPRPETGLEGLPAAAVEEACWWEAHITEVVYGLRPDAPAGTRPRPQYDPERTSLTEREKAKAAELSAAGKKVPASTVKHRRQRWEAYGLPGLQELLDEWLVAFWLNRPHDGLRDPEHPGRAFTPDEKYAALIEAAGYVPVALSGDDYIELLPAEWRKVSAYGIKLARRSYDGEELNPLRLQPSGISEHGDRWEIRHDPYDVSKIHVRGLDGWITVFWKHLDRARSAWTSSGPQ